jgi:hypothetical protein
MATTSCKVRVTHVPVKIHEAVTNTIIGKFIPSSAAILRIYLFNMCEENDYPVYVGDENVSVGEGIVIPSGPIASRSAVELSLRPDSELYAVSKMGKPCWLGILEVQ